MVNKRLHEKAHKHVKSAIDEIMSESLPSIGKGLYQKSSKILTLFSI